MKIFVSSTYQDLESYLTACIQVMDRLRAELAIDWVGMESFDANDSSPKDYCLKLVRESDVYVGIFGVRYGFIDETEGKSITELEYREAKRSGLPCLIYLNDEGNALFPSKDVEIGIGAFKLRDLKRELSDLIGGHVVDYFSNESDLASKLSTGIIKAEKMFIASGGLRKRIEEAIAKGIIFIRDMEHREAGGWSYFEISQCTCYDTAYSILALTTSEAENVTPELHRGQHWLMEKRNKFGGWKSAWEQNIDASNTVDTSIALAALTESGYEEQPWEIKLTSNYLIRAQLSCGGWPYVVGLELPATAATAWAIRSLRSSGFSISDDWALRAKEWLMKTQRYDGGWGADQNSSVSTIGKTRDALMALSHFGLSHTSPTINNAREWLINARSSFKTPEEFGKGIGVEPHGVNPLVENIIYFLEAAFYAGVPAIEESIKNDLEWLVGRRWWSYTPQAVWCLCQYRKLVTY